MLAITSSTANIGRSYVSQSRSDHSLVTVIREDHETCFNAPSSAGGPANTKQRPSLSEDDEEEDLDTSEDEESDEESDEDSEAALTRIHRFCWAICCCCCRASCRRPDCSCHQTEDDGDGLQPVVEDKTHSCCDEDCSPASMWDRWLEFRTYMRDMLEFAEYGKRRPFRYCSNAAFAAINIATCFLYLILVAGHIALYYT
jgi:hypothetical protein